MEIQTEPQFIRRIVRAAAACGFALGLVVMGNYAFAGIANTKHNLGSTGAAGQNKTSSTEEICVFCHTPHGADTTAPAPLWNKNLTTGASYTVYSTANSSTIDGAVATDGLGGGAVGSVSLACLSCHDGTQAMDNIINAPGSGGLTNGGGQIGLGFSWTGSPRTDADGRLTGVANLGGDLSNDHPIGIQYCGGGPNATTPTAACKDTDFRGSGGDLKNATINGQLVWWVDVGTAAGARDKSDMILYTRNFAGTTGPSVECASCHDPHVEGGTGVAGATFLRVANTGSAVCLSCHVK